jgi:hypothetical protein
MKLYNRNQLAKESDLAFDYCDRVIRKQKLQPSDTNDRGQLLYTLEGFTEALEEYRKNSFRFGVDHQPNDLENERLVEVVRGLRLKNNILANKLIPREDVFTYISEYVSSELQRVKILLLQKLILKCRNKTSTELHTLGKELYNEYLRQQSDYVKAYYRKTQLDKEKV